MTARVILSAAKDLWVAPQTGAILLITVGCSANPSLEWHEEGAYRWRALAVPRRGGPGFTQLPGSKTGLEFSNTVSEELTLQNRHLTQGAGVALGDVDGDGLVDIYLSRTEGPNALYKNLGNWRFEDVGTQAGVTAADRFSTAVAFADVDGDGDLDLLVTALGGPNALFVNDGSGSFTELTDEAGLQSDRGSTTMTLADIDGDGDLDLYIANYKLVSALDLFAPEERRWEQVVQQRGDRYEIAPSFREHYRVLVLSDLGVVVRIQRAEPDWLYLNDGTGRFERAAFTANRFVDEDGQPLTSEPDYFGLAARFYDVDNDGDPDLYVCNDFEDPDQFWINDGSGRFRAAPRLALRTTSNSSMAVDFADIDRDGDVDFFVVDMLSRDSKRRATQTPTHTPLPKLVGEIENRPQMQRNTLFLNRGDGTFAQIADFAGVPASEWSWATLFLDVDLDGHEDILVATGHVWDVMDADTQQRIQRAPARVDWRRERLLYPQLHLKNVAFRNNGDLTFDEVGETWGFATEEDISHGLAAGDLDGDGDLDVVVNRLGRPAGVFRNDATAHRVAVRLLGEAPNTQGIGAKIRVLGGPVREQQKEVTLGGLYLSSSEPLYSFAAGDREALTIVVDWRSGRRSVIEGVRPNRLYEITEAGATASSPAAPAAPTTSPASALFTDASAQLGHRHIDSLFDDYARQPLLPNALSQLGPGITWYDVDRDGDEDLLVPSGRGGTLAYYRNDAGRLRHVVLRMPSATLDQTTVLAIPADTLGTLLLVGQMNYEAEHPAAAIAAPGVLRLNISQDDYRLRALFPDVAEAVPGAPSSTGPLALADVDDDGDLDLFVGGRVVPGRYPAPASSRLFRNEAGHFTLDTTNSRTFAELGLVSAAVFSDVDTDGDPDLLLAVEWGPLRLFLNEAGRFTDATAQWGLAEYPSRWNGVTTGDLNGDGRPDLVATSWGRNTKYQPRDRRPLLLYYGDFDHNGSVDVVHAQFDADRRAAVLLEPLSGVASGIPATRLRVPSFSAYADATLDDVIGPGLDDARRLELTTFDHMLFLNRGRSFEPRSLAREAQFAPAHYAGVADFDGDGHEDVFLSQNFFPTEIGTARYDAGRGLLLKGNGTGNLVPVPGQASGIAVYGDQRGAAFADYNADGRVDLVISQNGAATKLYRNERAQPGLRVRLEGSRNNPHAIGAMIRLVYPAGRGPAREIQGGSGYWSHNGAVQVLGLAGQPTKVWVRWPGGAEREEPIAPGLREITIRMEQ